MSIELLVESAAASSPKVWLSSWQGGALGGTPANWATPAFDDSAWDSPIDQVHLSFFECVPVTRIYPTEAFDGSKLRGLVWLARLSFTLAEVPESAWLNVGNDDSADYYVNGTLVRSSAFDIHCATDRSIDPSLLVVGDNVLAVRLTNASTAGAPWSTNPSYLIARLYGDFPAEPVVAEAWDIYAANDLLGSPITTLENAKRRYIRSALHDVGEGGFVINRHAAEATEVNLAEGNMVKVRIPDCGTDYLDGFFLGPDGDYTLLAATGGHGREDLTFKGPGALDYLDRARMTPCAFSVDATIDTWTEQWQTTHVPHPSGTAWISTDPDYVYVGSQRSRRIYKVRMSDQVVVGMSPVLWSGSTHWLGGLGADPTDDTILWALETPWIAGSSANTKVRKISIAGGITAAAVASTIDLGSAITHSAIKTDGTVLFLPRYSTSSAAHSVYTRNKTTGAVISSGTVTYAGTVQTKASGISVNGSDVALWFSGTKRALLSTTAAPRTVTGSISTRTISAFGGEWFTSGGDEFFAMCDPDAGVTWLYQVTANVPQCADASGVFHPEQTSPGALAWRVLIEITHVDRPVQECPELVFDFTETADSSGTPWPARTSTEEFTWRVGDRAYSDVLARLIPAGVTFDMDVNTMTLHAYVDSTFGTDRTSATFAAGKVRFQEGTNLGVNGDFSRRDNRGLPATYITVAGDNGVYGAAALAGTYERSGFMQVSGATTEAVLDAIGADELARQRLVAQAAGFETVWGDPAEDTATQLAGRYIPKKHYWKGDLVTVDMAPGEFTYQEASLRVYGTLITERDGGWRAALDTGSAYKVPPAVDGVGGQSSSGSSDGAGGGSSSGGSAVPAPPLYVVDPISGNIIPNVSVIKHDGAYSPTPGTAVLPRGSTDTPLVEELLTDETDTSKALHPDGLGGVGWGEPDENAEGAIAIRYTFDTTTADADPGAGLFRLSNATQSSAVTARADLTDANGVDVTAELALIADQVSTTKGYLRIQKTGDPTKWLLATVSALATPAGYRNVTIANIAKSTTSPLANGDPITVIFVPGALAHGAAHASGGADAVKLDDLAAPDDNTDLDAGTGAHGLMKKFPGGTASFLRADGTFAAVGAEASTIFRGCRAKHSTTQSLNNNTYTPLLLDTDDYDTDNFHFTSNANLTGTVTKTSGSTTITGSGTSFTTELAVNQIISIPGTAEEWFVITAIASNTSLTVAAAAANTAAGQTGKRISQAMAVPTGLGGYYQVISATPAAINATGGRRVFAKRNSFAADLTTGSINPTASWGEVAGFTTMGVATANKLLSAFDYVTLVGFQNSGGAGSLGSGTGEPISTMLQLWRVG